MFNPKHIMDKLTIVTADARGLNNTKKKLSLFQWIKDHKIDVTFVQESV